MESLKNKIPIRVENVDEYPYSAIGIVLVTYKEDKKAFHSTGCLIGSKLVLTALPNYNLLRKYSEMEIEFVPAPLLKRGGRGFKACR